ncbi:bZIP transcription factor 44 [Linum grandiflorum]
MASSSTGASSGSSGGEALLRNSSSEEDLQAAVVDERKRKRKLSNRESARRSRLRKQKHMDDLTAQVAQLKKENAEILTSMNLNTQLLLGVEADNSVLRAQAAELNHRLESLGEILNYVDTLRNGAVQAAGGSSGTTSDDGDDPFEEAATDECLMTRNEMNPWIYSSTYQPMMMDMVMY